MLKKLCTFALFSTCLIQQIHGMRPLNSHMPSRHLDNKTEKIIAETTDPEFQTILYDFVRNPQSESVQTWLSPHGFNGLSNTELLNAITPISVYEGVLLLSLVALDDKFDDSFNNMRSQRLGAKNFLNLAQNKKALTACKNATMQLETEVMPTFEKIKNINEKLDGAAAKIAHNIFSSLKKAHSKIMIEESKIEECRQQAKDRLSAQSSQPAASPSPE